MPRIETTTTDIELVNDSAEITPLWDFDPAEVVWDRTWFIVETQYMENYGACDWDGTGDCPSYWKFKGGSTYHVYAETEDEAISRLQLPDDNYCQEYVLTCHAGQGDPNAKTKGEIACTDNGYCYNRVNRKFLNDK